MNFFICNVIFQKVFSIRNFERKLAINESDCVRRSAINDIERVARGYLQKYKLDSKDIKGLYNKFTKNPKYEGTAIRENWYKSEKHVKSVFYISLLLYGLIFFVLYWAVSSLFSYFVGNGDLSWYFTTFSRLLIMPFALIAYFEIFVQSVFDKRDFELMRLDAIKNN